ncbi:MAG: Response regulator protein TmoT [Pseudomonadota bacterium]|jgi:FixJ family two-component response regulator
MAQHTQHWVDQPVELAQQEPGTHGYVYLVDDDQAIRTHVGALLRLLGYTVRTFEGAAAFLDHMPLEFPAVVLLDMTMPGMSGLEVQRRIADPGERATVLYLSGNSQRQDIVDAMKAGAVDFLWKPVPRDKLADAVAAAMARSAEATRRFAELARIRAGLTQLSNRERDVYELMVNGLQNRQIAARLGIQADTVKKHRSVICEKFMVEDTAALIELTRIVGSSRAADGHPAAPPARLPG